MRTRLLLRQTLTPTTRAHWPCHILPPYRIQIAAIRSFQPRDTPMENLDRSLEFGRGRPANLVVFMSEPLPRGWRSAFQARLHKTRVGATEAARFHTWTHQFFMATLAPEAVSSADLLSLSISEVVGRCSYIFNSRKKNGNGFPGPVPRLISPARAPTWL